MSNACFCNCIMRGMAAGIVGTAVITETMALDRKIRHRQGGEGPGKTAGSVLGVEPVDEQSKERFSRMVHWGYGIGWGAMRGLLAGIGLKGTSATLMHFLAIWGVKLTIATRLQGSPPPWKKEVKEVGIDALHHAAYAGAVGLAFELMGDG
jgi:hypothetical protein